MAQRLTGTCGLLVVASVIAVVSVGCDSGTEVEPSPEPATIKFLIAPTATICKKVHLVAEVRDVNGLGVAKIMVEDSVAGSAYSLDGTEKRLDYTFIFEQPGVYTVKTLVIDDDGETTEDSVTIDVQPDPTFDFWSMDVGRTSSFQLFMDGRYLSGAPPRQIRGRLEWTVVGSSPTETGYEHMMSYHFVGEQRDFEWNVGWGAWVEETRDGAFKFEESETGVVESGFGGPEGFRILFPIPRYHCVVSSTVSGSYHHGHYQGAWTLERQQGIKSLYERVFSSGTDKDYTLTAED